MEFYDKYQRFKHYRETHGGVYVYPEYDEDLDAILEYVENDLMGFDEYAYDCAWINPEGEAYDN